MVTINDILVECESKLGRGQQDDNIFKEVHQSKMYKNQSFT